MSLEKNKNDYFFGDLIQNSDLSQETKKAIAQADIVLLPTSFITSHQRGSFPSETPNLLKYIRKTNPKLKVCVFENEGEERICLLQAEDIYLPIIYFCITNIGLPIVISLLTDYIKQRYNRDSKKDTQTVKVEFLIEDKLKGQTKYYKLSYPVSELEKIITINQLNEDITEE